MEKTASRSGRKDGPPAWLFWGLTAAYSLCAIAMVCHESTRLWPMTKEEAGSLLAGIFSPLAFLWLIYTALSQRTELALQREEIEKNTLAQEAQADSLNAQVAVLNAQADALYEPVFVLSSSEAGITISTADTDTKTTCLHISNVGAMVTNVRPATLYDAQLGHRSDAVTGHVRETIRGNVAQCWPHGETIKVQILALEKHQIANLRPYDAVIDLTCTRLDGARFVYCYVYWNSEQRLEFVDRRPVEAARYVMNIPVETRGLAK